MRISAPAARPWCADAPVVTGYTLAVANGSAVAAPVEPAILGSAGCPPNGRAHSVPFTNSNSQPLRRVTTNSMTVGAASISGSAHAYIQRFAERDSVRKGVADDAYSSEDAQLRILAQMSGEARANLIALAVRSRPLGEGREARVYMLPGFDALVLRASRRMGSRPLTDERLVDTGSALENWSDGRLAFTRVTYDGGLAPLVMVRDLGIPRAVLVPYDHPFAKAQGLAPYDIHLWHPGEAERDAVEFVLLRRCAGRRLGESHVAAYEDMMTAANAASEISPAARYRSFLDAYALSLRGLIALPESSYQAAFGALVACESASPSVVLDFQHTGNVVLDNVGARFGFFDLGFMPPSQSRSIGALGAEFIALLLGKRRPREWQCIHAGERAEFRILFGQLFKKIAAATSLQALQIADRRNLGFAEFADCYGDFFQ